MSSATDESRTSSARLDEALADYMQRSDLGESVDREAFLQKYPDIRQELQSFFRVADEMANHHLGGLLEGRTLPTATRPARSPAGAAAGTKPTKQRARDKNTDKKDEQDKQAKPAGPGIRDRMAMRMQRMSRWLRRAHVPAWMVSTIVHALVIILLALMSIFIPREEEPHNLLVATTDEIESEIEELQEVELEVNEQVDDLAEPIESEMISEALSDFQDTSAPQLTTELSTFGLESALPNDLSNILGATVGDGKPGMGGGFKGAATFFGTKSAGQRFCFVVDNSLSMGQGKFETALNELMKTVGQMSPQQSFYVVFFSDTAYGMFHPQPAARFVPATEENKRRLGYWLERVELCLRTDAHEAVEKAMYMRPDAIYILGDGAFTDDTAKFLIANAQNRVPINVLGMLVKNNVAATFKEIAVKNAGTYKDVGIDPAMAKLAKTNPRKRHRFKGEVWGIKLKPEK